MCEKFFAWLDRRRDKKLERQIKLIEAQRASINEPLNKALSALQSHTELMHSWLSGFQNLSHGTPFTSVMRDEDELHEEQMRKRAQNIDGIIPEIELREISDFIKGL